MRARLAGFAAVAIAAGAVLLIGHGGKRYHVSVPLRSGYGLKDGGAVRIGGTNRGTLQLRLTKDDQVVADLDLDTPVGEDARVMVVSANFLGAKRMEIDPGDVKGHLAPDGYRLDGDTVTAPTDLDQMLAVFDADTRTRMKILLNEAGEAVVGRRVDISTLLKEFPVGLQDAQAVIGQIKTSNATMRSLIERSDGFIAEAARQRSDLGRMVDVLGGASATVSARREQLRQTLARAPQMLRTLRAFSTDLLATTRDLGPAAREIRATAPSLAGALNEVDGFRAAAVPALDTGADVAPSLSRLAKGATPVLREANPTAQALAELGEALPPVTATLDNSFDNIIAVVENWSRAIQFRDGLSHVFRGQASFSPDAVVSMVQRLTGGGRPKHRHKPQVRRPKPAAHIPVSAPVTEATKQRIKQIVAKLPRLPGVSQTLDDVLDGVGQATPPNPDLLDFLLKP